jgi:hypothetical protein
MLPCIVSEFLIWVKFLIILVAFIFVLAVNIIIYYLLSVFYIITYILIITIISSGNWYKTKKRVKLKLKPNWLFSSQFSYEVYEQKLSNFFLYLWNHPYYYAHANILNTIMFFSPLYSTIMTILYLANPNCQHCYQNCQY